MQTDGGVEPPQSHRNLVAAEESSLLRNEGSKVGLIRGFPKALRWVQRVSKAGLLSLRALGHERSAYLIEENS